MDKLVAQYSRSPHQNEFYSEQEQHDLTESLPPLSLKFSLPPVDNVSYVPIMVQCGIGASDGVAAMLLVAYQTPNRLSSNIPDKRRH
jgi:hypothetical protein